jgi:hypothetical protein
MSSVLSFIRAHAKSSRTTVTVEDGVTLRLGGMPSVYTAAGLKKLATAQAADVKGSVRTKLEDGKRVSTSFALEGERAGQLIAGETESRAGRRQTAMANGEPVTTNGAAS